MPNSLEHVIRRYHQEGIVFLSPRRNNNLSHAITSVDTDGCDVRQLDSSETSHILFSDLEAAIAAVRQREGRLPLQTLGETTTFQTLCLQAPASDVSADRKDILDLSSEVAALQNFEQLIRGLNVNKSGPSPTLYKPVILWCVLDGILKKELTNNQILFDWIAPRFLKKSTSLGLAVAELNAAQAFFHLATDLFWMLAYQDPLQFLQSTPSLSLLNKRVKYASIKDTYWQLFANGDSVKTLLTTLEDFWFPPSMDIDLSVLDLAVEKTIRPFLIDQGKLQAEDAEGYVHDRLLPKVQPLLSEAALNTDAKGKVEAALKGSINLLSQYEQMAGIAFVKACDADELQERILDLLYGPDPLLDRLQRFWEWSKPQKTQDGTKSGLNVTAIGYLLGIADPHKYAFCKPTIYTAAVNSLLHGKGPGDEAKLERLVHATDFYTAALKLFRNRYHLPFRDLLDVHTAFYVMKDNYHGLPAWNDLEGKESPVAVQHDLNVILYGPPGTGKTFHTVQRAVEICDGRAPNDRSELMERFKHLRGENRIGFITFHQSYAYEDFVEGIRPVLQDASEGIAADSSSDVRYECRPGVFKQLCSFAKSRPTRKRHDIELDLGATTVWKMSLGNTQDPGEAGIYDECIDNNYLLLGYGLGLNFSDCGSAQEVFEKLKRVNPEIKKHDFNVQSMDRFKNQMQEGDLVVISDGNHKYRAIARVTGGYKFLKRESYEQMRPVEWLAVFEESLPREIIYDKVFSQMTIYRLGPKDLRLDPLRSQLAPAPDGPHNYVLIIDEINRGNVAKILGELITLLEPDKRLGQENELQVMLPYSGETFGVPANLYLVGTMNTADRSIAFLDVALRRRFNFIEMMPDLDILRELVGEEGIVDGVDVPQLLEAVNSRIELLYDRDHQIGHSFFLGVQSLQDLRDVFCSKVIPLLSEYFYGDWNKICLVLGCPFGDPVNAIKQIPHPIIRARSLRSNFLLSGQDDMIEDKVRCEVDRDFAASDSLDVLQAYFAGLIATSGAS